MKATELMIGDWILYGDRPVKVLQLSENSKYDWVKPIPITKAILRHSGWDVTDSPATQGKPIGKIKVKRQGDYDYEIQYRIGHYFRLDAFLRKELMKPDEVYYFFPPVTIMIDHNWGVHELQHALRLLGFDDVADSFKI